MSAGTTELEMVGPGGGTVGRGVDMATMVVLGSWVGGVSLDFRCWVELWVWQGRETHGRRQGAIQKSVADLVLCAGFDTVGKLQWVGMVLSGDSGGGNRDMCCSIVSTQGTHSGEGNWHVSCEFPYSLNRLLDRRALGDFRDIGDASLW